MVKVLVVTINYRKAYPVVKSFKKKGTIVVGVYIDRTSPSIRFSRYLDKAYRVPDPEKNISDYVKEIKKIVVDENIDLVVPVGFRDVYILSHVKEHLTKYAIVPVPDPDIIEIVSRKDLIIKLLNEIKIPYPETLVYPMVSVDEIIERLGLPVVVKGLKDNSKPSIIYDNNRLEEELNVRKHCLVQDYIVGYGCGFFAFSVNGKIYRFFMHKRIYETNVFTGASAKACSYYDRLLYEYGRRFVEHTKWTGVIMVEFRRDIETGKYFLIEINPKFWGSLELSLEAGVDFPGAIYDYYVNGIIPKPQFYTDTCFTWLIDLANHISLDYKLGLKRLLGELAKNTFRNDIIKLDDPLYSFVQSLRLVNKVKTLIKKHRVQDINCHQKLKRLIHELNKYNSIAIILDLDGTIVDLKVPWHMVYRRLCLEGLLKKWDNIQISLYKYWLANRNKYALLSKILDEYELKAVEKINHDTELEKIFHRLKQLDTIFCVATKQSKKSAIKALEKIGIIKYIDEIITRDIHPLKINQVKVCLQRIGANKFVVGLGDTFVDLRAYRKNRVEPILITKNNIIKLTYAINHGIIHFPNLKTFLRLVIRLWSDNLFLDHRL